MALGRDTSKFTFGGAAPAYHHAARAIGRKRSVSSHGQRNRLNLGKYFTADWDRITQLHQGYVVPPEIWEVAIKRNSNI